MGNRMDNKAGRMTGATFEVGRPRTRLAAGLITLVALVLIAAGCGDDDDKGVASPTDSSTAVSTDTSADDATDGSDADDDDGGGDDEPTETSTTEPDDEPTETTADADPDGDTTTSAADEVDNELPGEPIDLFVEIGDVLAVVGVADDDTLNVRAKPGSDQDILAELPPNANDLVSTGKARSLPNSIWFEVSAGGQIGWVSSSFVAYIGGTDDATAEFLDGELPPAAETMTDLGRLVAETFASEDPPSEIVQTEAPSVGDLGEVTYDVIGIGDDAVRGFRLRIFAIEDDNGETFSLRTIERTTLCTRGLDGERCT